MKNKQMPDATLINIYFNAILLAIILFFLLPGAGFGQENASYRFNSSSIGGTNSSGFGVDALTANSGAANSAIGYRALYHNISGIHNTAAGYSAMRNNVIGNRNVAIGNLAGYNSLGDGNVYIGYQAGAGETGSNKFYLANDTVNTLIYGDFSRRQILVGIANPYGYTFNGSRTLNVLGGIFTDSVRVALSTNWADYVFDDSYELATLDEVSNFIKTNKHLPGIPTTEDVKRDGINLGEINAQLLAKIEELTLYMLQQKKQIESQQKEMDDIKLLLKKISVPN